MNQLDIWHHITIENEVSFTEGKMKSTVLLVAQQFQNFLDNGMIDLWHYRYGVTWISFRVRVNQDMKDTFINSITTLKEILLQVIERIRITDEPRKWSNKWSDHVESLGSEESWHLWMIVLHHLTMVVINTMKMNNSYWMVIHQYFNLLGFQEMGKPYHISPERHGALKNALGDNEYNALLAYVSKLLKSPEENLPKLDIFAVLFASLMSR